VLSSHPGIGQGEGCYRYLFTSLLQQFRLECMFPICCN
jgi:hypothetical protein